MADDKVTSIDAHDEFEIMKQCVALFERLPKEAHKRVLLYLLDRFRPPQGTGAPGDPRYYGSPGGLRSVIRHPHLDPGGYDPDLDS